jgi:phage protein D
MTASLPPDRPILSVKVNNGEMNGIVRSVDVEDHDRLIDRARIEVQDRDNVCTNFAREGQKVRIEMGWGSQRAAIFEGFITHVEGFDSRSYPRTVMITALDPSYKMNLLRRIPNRHVGKLSEIIRRVAQQYAEYFDIGEIVVASDVEFSEAAPLLQRNETDLQFLYRLANLYGARTFVEYNRAEGETEARSLFYFVSEQRLMQGDRLTTLRYCPGIAQVINFDYQRHASDAQPQRTAVAVNPADGISVEARGEIITAQGPPDRSTAEHIVHIERQGRSADSYRAAQEATQQAKEQPEDLRHHYAETGLPSDPNLIQQVTRQDPTRYLGLRGTGIAVGNIHLRAKGKIGITGFSIWDEGDWYVHKVNHKMTQARDESNQSYRTHFEVSR